METLPLSYKHTNEMPFQKHALANTLIYCMSSHNPWTAQDSPLTAFCLTLLCHDESSSFSQRPPRPYQRKHNLTLEVFKFQNTFSIMLPSLPGNQGADNSHLGMESYTWSFLNSIPIKIETVGACYFIKLIQSSFRSVYFYVSDFIMRIFYFICKLYTHFFYFLRFKKKRIINV